jgi:hypothetical protein
MPYYKIDVNRIALISMRADCDTATDRIGDFRIVESSMASFGYDPKVVVSKHLVYLLSGYH